MGCSVFGCTNSTANTKNRVPKVRFYIYPAESKDRERRRVWIRFASRTNPDGSEWQPTKFSRVCSDHFVGGEKSYSPLSTAYNPTIRPEQARQSNIYANVPSSSSNNRTERTMKRNLKINIDGKTITVIPPRARKGQGQFTLQQMETTKKIASVRIHVERVIQRMKIYKILSHRMDLRMLPYVDKIVKVCAILANFQAPIIKPNLEDEEEVAEHFDDIFLEGGASGDEGSDLDDDVLAADSDEE